MINQSIAFHESICMLNSKGSFNLAADNAQTCHDFSMSGKNGTRLVTLVPLPTAPLLSQTF